jgi:hypothetical protein
MDLDHAESLGMADTQRSHEHRKTNQNEHQPLLEKKQGLDSGKK